MARQAVSSVAAGERDPRTLHGCRHGSAHADDPCPTILAMVGLGHMNNNTRTTVLSAALNRFTRFKP
eukprot:10848232-Alexandrium_andersonii.AAC.1